MVFEDDLVIQININGPEVYMSILHRPTGIVVEGEGYSQYQVRDELMDELEQEVRLREENE